MSEGSKVARLIAVSGIANNVEAEMRATSALLSVLTIVRDLSVAHLTPLWRILSEAGHRRGVH